jgi:hypothetical protein
MIESDMLAGYRFWEGRAGGSGRDGGSGGSMVGDLAGGVENMEERRCLQTPDKEGG